MSEFVNTRDVIGDQATVDGLVSHTLTELKEDGIGILAPLALSRNAGLTLVELPGISEIGGSAFSYCPNLETVILGGYGSTASLEIGTYVFTGCYKLKHLVIDRPEIPTLAYTYQLLNQTLIEKGEGAIYVPESLISSYKSDLYWKNYIIARLQDYPLSVFDTIGDSWSTILTNSDYATAYAIKGTKTVELTDGTKIKMDLAAVDTDIKSDDSGTAKMTWICHGIPYMHRMNATATASGGWASSEMRSWLISDILSKIPTEIKSHIVSVKKSYRTKSPNDETLWSDDEIWIPSYKEVGFTSSYYVESDGVTYSRLFNSSTARIKYNTSDTEGFWWLRSACYASSFAYVYSSGSDNNTSGNYEEGVVFGFCTD